MKLMRRERRVDPPFPQITQKRGRWRLSPAPGGVPRPLARGRGASRPREEPGACFCLLGSADLWPPGAAALLFRRGRRLRQDDYVFFPFEGFFTVSFLANTWTPLAFILSRQRRFPALPL